MVFVSILPFISIGQLFWVNGSYLANLPTGISTLFFCPDKNTNFAFVIVKFEKLIMRDRDKQQQTTCKDPPLQSRDVSSKNQNDRLSSHHAAEVSQKHGTNVCQEQFSSCPVEQLKCQYSFRLRGNNCNTGKLSDVPKLVIASLKWKCKIMKF